MAFTDFGIETLVDLIKIHKDNPDASEALRAPNTACRRPTPDGYPPHDRLAEIEPIPDKDHPIFWRYCR